MNILRSPHIRRFFAHAFIWSAALLVASCASSPQNPDSAKADAILKQTCQALSSAKALSFSGSRSASPSLTRTGTDRGTSTMAGVLVRPNRFKGSVTDSGGQRQFFYDGTNLDIYDATARTHARLKAPATFDALFQMLDEQYGFDLPAGDFLLAHSYAELTEDHPVGKVMGVETIAGVRCQHLEFSEKDARWELWVDPNSLPRRFRHTFIKLPGQPVLTVEINKWDLNPKVDVQSFTFHTPKGTEETSLVPQ